MPAISEVSPATPPTSPTSDLPEGVSVAARTASLQSALSKTSEKPAENGEKESKTDPVASKTTTYSFSTIKIEDEHLQTERNVSKISISANKPETVPVEVAMTETVNQKLKQIDYELDPREINSKANKTKGSALGLSIIAASEVNTR